MTFFSKEDTNRCFDEFVDKGYIAAIVVVGKPIDKNLGILMASRKPFRCQVTVVRLPKNSLMPGRKG